MRLASRKTAVLVVAIGLLLIAALLSSQVPANQNQREAMGYHHSRVENIILSSPLTIVLSCVVERTCLSTFRATGSLK